LWNRWVLRLDRKSQGVTDGESDDNKDDKQRKGKILQLIAMLTLGSNESRFFLRRSSIVFLVSGVILRASNVWISSFTPRFARKLHSSIETILNQLMVTYLHSFMTNSIFNAHKVLVHSTVFQLLLVSMTFHDPKLFFQDFFITQKHFNLEKKQQNNKQKQVQMWVKCTVWYKKLLSTIYWYSKIHCFLYFKQATVPNALTVCIPTYQYSSTF